MKYQVSFSLKNNEKIFMNAVCCSCDWPFKGNSLLLVTSQDSEQLQTLFIAEILMRG